jgi:hypothetical protein
LPTRPGKARTFLIRAGPNRVKGELSLAYNGKDWFTLDAARMWWNWQTRYFEVVVPQGVQVQVLPCAPSFSVWVPALGSLKIDLPGGENRCRQFNYLPLLGISQNFD